MADVGASFVQFILATGFSFFLLMVWMEWMQQRDKEHKCREEARTEPIPSAVKSFDSSESANTVTNDGTSFIIPSHLVVQLFSDIEYHEASMLLEQAGVAHPNKIYYYLDEPTEAAIQRVVDYLVGIYYGDVPTSQEEESAYECPICCDDFLIDQMVACRDSNHLFCTECLRRHAQELVFGAGRLGKSNGDDDMLIELMCMSDKCSSTFPDSVLQRALPPKVLERYGELQGTLSVAQANLDDLWYVCVCVSNHRPGYTIDASH